MFVNVLLFFFPFFFMTNNNNNVDEIIDTLIVGAGPSGLTLSYLLSGNEPYYDDSSAVFGAHPIAQLHEKLTAVGDNDENSHDTRTLYQFNISALADGLGGRSKNPVSLLWDALLYPLVDMQGDIYPPHHYLKFRHRPTSCKRSHVIVDQAGQTGGSWQQMTAQFSILSPASWMLLPGATDYPPLRTDRRVSRETVAKYYAEYPRLAKLEPESIALNTRVTGARWSDEQHHWVVQGQRRRPQGGTNIATYDGNQTEEIVEWHARRLVVAGGSYEVPLRLGITGEDLPFVSHRFHNHRPEPGSTVLVVGAGLSAADAINHYLQQSLQYTVVHCFRSDLSNPEQAIAKFAGSRMYPEYAALHRAMTSPPASNYEPLHPFVLQEIRRDGTCVMADSTNQANRVTRVAHHVLVLVGSRPNLDWLPAPFNVPNVHSKKNPLLVDLPSHQLLSSRNSAALPSLPPPRTLYSIGSETGDNFVRFVTGHAFGAAQSILFPSM